MYAHTWTAVAHQVHKLRYHGSICAHVPTVSPIVSQLAAVGNTYPISAALILIQSVQGIYMEDRGTSNGAAFNPH